MSFIRVPFRRLRKLRSRRLGSRPDSLRLCPRGSSLRPGGTVLRRRRRPGPGGLPPRRDPVRRYRPLHKPPVETPPRWDQTTHPRPLRRVAGRHGSCWSFCSLISLVSQSLRFRSVPASGEGDRVRSRNQYYPDRAGEGREGGRKEARKERSVETIRGSFTSRTRRGAGGDGSTPDSV